jgi:hypothetical protein
MVQKVYVTYNEASRRFFCAHRTKRRTESCFLAGSRTDGVR